MKLGVLPLFTKSCTNDPEWVAKFIRMIEDQGVESVWMSEHVIWAENYQPLYEYSDDGLAPTGPDTVIPDPLDWLAFAAAHSHKLRLATGVIIGPQQSAAILAKRLATIDTLSGGRLEAGIGIGWQKEEYQAVGVPYRQRGKRLDECIDAIRALWRDDPATFNGEFIQFERVFMDTKPVQNIDGGVPFLIGGNSDAAARRTGSRGNGYYPYVISPEDLAHKISIIQQTAQQAGRDPQQLPVTVWPGSYRPELSFDLDFVKQYADLGVSRLLISCHESADTSIDGLRRLIGNYQDNIIAKL